MKTLGKLFMYYVVGGIVFSVALLSDVAIIAAMLVLVLGFKLTGLILTGIFCYLWFFGKNTKAFGNFDDRPFSGWKPSTVKAFWRNWKQVCE